MRDEKLEIVTEDDLTSQILVRTAETWRGSC